jgi:hypothetical protein
MTTIWLGIGMALAGIVMIGPLPWAMAIAAMTLPMAATMVLAVGADPITLPVLTTLAFCLRHAMTLVTKPQREVFLSLVAREWPLVVLVGYALVSGVFFPRLFAGMTVVPAQDMARDGFAILGPNLVSFPQMAYFLVGAYFYIALRQSILRVGPMPLVIGGVIQALAFGGMGFLQAILGLVGVQFPVDWLVTNTQYALLATVETAGFVRVTAGFVEASAWAGWAAGPLAFCYALFINRVAALPALVLGGAIAAAMLLSTSSSAYAGLLVLSVIAVAHVLIDPSPARRLRALVVLGVGALVFGAVAGLILTAEPGQGFLGDLRMMLEEMTVRKQYSSSAIERGRMAEVGFQAGLDTFGRGAGVWHGPRLGPHRDLVRGDWPAGPHPVHRLRRHGGKDSPRPPPHPPGRDPLRCRICLCLRHGPARRLRGRPGFDEHDLGLRGHRPHRMEPRRDLSGSRRPTTRAPPRTGAGRRLIGPPHVRRSLPLQAASPAGPKALRSGRHSRPAGSPRSPA